MKPVAVAFFVTPHGFGHAARAAAVVEALRRRWPRSRPEIFTTLPRWFFDDALTGPFGWHSLLTDVGLAQRTAVEEDPAATVARLEAFYPFDRSRLDRLASWLEELGCAAVVADISPLGIEAARRAGLPSLLVENFTWDWIYRAYLTEEPRLGRFADAFEAIFASATVRIQTEPVCQPVDGASRVPPVSRRPRAGRAATRKTLGLTGRSPLVLVTMGGAGWLCRGADLPPGAPDADVVWIGGVDRPRRRGRLLRLPDRSPVYLPDLVAASDLVIGKLGYSTVAEAVRAGTRFLCVRRPRFPEYRVLARYVRSRLPAAEISSDELDGGAWVRPATELLARPRAARGKRGGAERIATEIAGVAGWR